MNHHGMGKLCRVNRQIRAGEYLLVVMVDTKDGDQIYEVEALLPHIERKSLLTSSEIS